MTYSKIKSETQDYDYTMKDRIKSAKKAFKDLIQNKASKTSK